MVSILYQTATGSLSTLTIDATLTREEVLAVKVTKYPVEDGSIISDHAISEPDTWRMEGLVSNAPAASAAAASWTAGRAEAARNTLRAIDRAKLPVTIDAGTTVLQSMVMETLSFPEDSTTGDALRFSATFVKISTVETLTTAVLKTAKAKKAGGKKPTEKAPEAVTKKKSTIKAAADAIRKKAGRAAIP